MKLQYQNIDIECWIHSGAGRKRLGLTEAAVCLFQSSSAPSESVLRALDELEACEVPAKRTIGFVPCDRKAAVANLRLRLVPASDELRLMHISCDPSAATIEMTVAGLHLVRKALITWHDGGEDFDVSPRHSKLKTHELGNRDRASAELWFWGPSYSPS